MLDLNALKLITQSHRTSTCSIQTGNITTKQYINNSPELTIPEAVVRAVKGAQLAMTTAVAGNTRPCQRASTVHCKLVSGSTHLLYKVNASDFIRKIVFVLALRPLRITISSSPFVVRAYDPRVSNVPNGITILLEVLVAFQNL